MKRLKGISGLYWLHRALRLSLKVDAPPPPEPAWVAAPFPYMSGALCPLPAPLSMAPLVVFQLGQLQSSCSITKTSWLSSQENQNESGLSRPTHGHGLSSPKHTTTFKTTQAWAVQPSNIFFHQVLCCLPVWLSSLAGFFQPTTLLPILQFSMPWHPLRTFHFSILSAAQMPKLWTCSSLSCS